MIIAASALGREEALVVSTTSFCLEPGMDVVRSKSHPHWTIAAFGLALSGMLAAGALRAGEPQAPAPKTERVSFKNSVDARNEVGEVLVESQDGGKLFLTADGQLWLLQPDEILAQAPCDQ